MTNFEKLASSKTAMAYWMMCPYGVEDEMCKDMCPNSNCIDCCLEWLFLGGGTGGGGGRLLSGVA